MSRKSILFRQRHLITFGTVLAISFLLYCQLGSVTGAAQTTTQETPATSAALEREFRNQIPPHLPIKIKVKNLNSERLLREMEIEVTNKSEKPIYYLKIHVFFPGIIGPSGISEVGYPLRYGRLALIRIDERARPEDVPILPGETYVFKFSEQDWLGWEDYVEYKKLPKYAPKKLGIRFEVLNFGDGTGYITTSGMPVPRNRTREQKILLEPARGSQAKPKEKAHASPRFNAKRKCSPNSLLSHASFFFTGEVR